jgi:metal-dependent hydrolase (beta-lactamase superfamily II)
MARPVNRRTIEKPPIMEGFKPFGILDRVKAIVLSHGHYDHTGGVPAMLEV